MILVSGATGFIGRQLIKRLMDEELPIRCLIPEHAARNLPWDTDHPFAPEVVVGNILDEEVVFQAVTGVQTIFHLENAQWWGRARNLERIEVEGTNNLINVARSARVGRIITVSHLGASPASAYTLYRIKGQVEEIVRNSGLAYTIIRPGIVFGEDDAFINHMAMMMGVNPLFFLMPGQGEVILHPIYIDDLIDVLVNSLESIDIVDQTIDVGGPEYTTLEDLTRTIMRVTGMQRIIIPLPPYVFRWLVAFFQFLLPRSIMTSQWLDILAAHRIATLGNTFTYFGFRPRRFEDTLLTYMPGRHYFWRALRYTFRRRPRVL